MAEKQEKNMPHSMWAGPGTHRNCPVCSNGSAHGSPERGRVTGNGAGSGQARAPRILSAMGRVQTEEALTGFNEGPASS